MKKKSGISNIYFTTACRRGTRTTDELRMGYLPSSVASHSCTAQRGSRSIYEVSKGYYLNTSECFKGVSAYLWLHK